MDYQNAISDRLVVCSRKDHTSLVIASSSSEAKLYIKNLDEADEHALKAILSASIFASTELIHTDVPFVLVPSGLSEEESELQFELSHGSPIGSLKRDRLDDRYDLVYQARELDAKWADLLVGLKESCGIACLHQYRQGLGSSNVMYISVLDDSMILRLYSGSRLILVNAFEIADVNEALYFCMNVVESLQIDKSKLHTEIIGSYAESEALIQLLDNYLPKVLHLPRESEQELDWFSEIAIACG